MSSSSTLATPRTTTVSPNFTGPARRRKWWRLPSCCFQPTPTIPKARQDGTSTSFENSSCPPATMLEDKTCSILKRVACTAALSVLMMVTCGSFVCVCLRCADLKGKELSVAACTTGCAFILEKLRATIWGRFGGETWVTPGERARPTDDGC